MTLPRTSQATGSATVESLAVLRDAHGETPRQFSSGRPLSPRAQGIEAEIRTLYTRFKSSGVLSGQGVGNASRRIPGTNHIVLSGFYPYTPYGDGIPRTVTIDLDYGSILEGEAHAGLIEVAPLYVAAHRFDHGIGSILHTHAPHLASFAVARLPLPLRLAAAQEEFGPAVQRIPVTRWGTRYEPEPIVEALRHHPGTPALIHGNHGPFVFGRDLPQAFRRLALLEEVADIELKAARLVA